MNWRFLVLDLLAAFVIAGLAHRVAAALGALGFVCLSPGVSPLSQSWVFSPSGSQLATRTASVSGCILGHMLGTVHGVAPDRASLVSLAPTLSDGCGLRVCRRGQTGSRISFGKAL